MANRGLQTPANEAYAALEQNTQRSEIVRDHIVDDLGTDRSTINIDDIPHATQVEDDLELDDYVTPAKNLDVDECGEEGEDEENEDQFSSSIEKKRRIE